MNNDLQVNGITMTSLEVVGLVNKLRLEEGNSKVKKHDDFMKSIKKELESLTNSGIEADGNISVGSYKDKQNQERPCFILNKQGIMQMLNKESAYVRYKTQQYIEVLEGKLKEQQMQLTELDKGILQAVKSDSIEERMIGVQIVIEETKKPLLKEIEVKEQIIETKEEFIGNVIGVSDECIGISEFAKLTKPLYGLGKINLFKVLRNLHILYYNSNKDNVPYQKYLDRGIFEVRETNKNGTIHLVTMITVNGQKYLHKRLNKWKNN